MVEECGEKGDKADSRKQSSKGSTKDSGSSAKKPETEDKFDQGLSKRVDGILEKIRKAEGTDKSSIKYQLDPKNSKTSFVVDSKWFTDPENQRNAVMDVMSGKRVDDYDRKTEKNEIEMFRAVQRALEEL